jgi:hypothetical protein
MRRLSVVFGVVVLAMSPSPARAQVELGFSFGAFWPLGQGWTPALGSSPPLADRRQIAAHMLIGRLAYWPGRRLGLEAAVGFSPSQVAVTDTRTRDVSGRVVLTSVRALARLASLVDGQPGSGFSRWYINAGVGAGIMSRQGNAWANISGTTHPGVLVSLDARTPLVGPVLMRVGFENWVSWATFDRGLQTETRRRVQNDLIFSLGTQIRFGKAVR